MPPAPSSLLLAVDVGNSHTTCGLFCGGTLQNHFRLCSNICQTADEIAAACQAQLVLRGYDLAGIGGCVLGSVVPVLERQWFDIATRYFPALRQPPLVVDHRLDCGMTLAIEQPFSLGVDRLINAAMAWQTCQAPCIAVDVGTALTCDCVNARGEFVGGVIAPGPALALNALVAGTARLPPVDLVSPLAATLGKNTAEAIRAGMLIGWGGMVDRLLERLEEELCAASSAARILATGGMAALLAPYSQRLKEIDPHLTLKGLAWLHQRHRAA